MDDENIFILKVLRKEDERIAKAFMEQAFPDDISRNTADSMLQELGPEFFDSTIKKNAPRHSFSSIIYNYEPNYEGKIKKDERKKQLINERIANIKIQFRVIGHQRMIEEFVTDYSGNIAFTASADKNVKAWHLPSLSLMKTLKGHNGHVKHIQLSPDGMLLASLSDEEHIKLWNPYNGACVSSIYDKELGNPVEMKFSPFGDLLGFITNKSYIVFVKLMEEPDVLKYISSKFDAISQTRVDLYSNRDLFDYVDRIVRFPSYDPMKFIKEPPQLLFYQPLISKPTCIEFSPGGLMYGFGLESGDVAILTVENKLQWTFTAHSDPVKGFKFLKNYSQYIVTYSHKEIKLWELRGSKCNVVRVYQLPGTSKRVKFTSICFSCDEVYLSTNTSAGFYVWRTIDGDFLMYIRGKAQISSVREHPFIPHIFAFGHKEGVSVVHVGIDKEVVIEKKHEGAGIVSVIWAKNGFSIYAPDSSGGFFVFKPADNPECHQFHQFFEHDFNRNSEWKPNEGQLDEQTKMPTHLYPTSPLIDNQKQTNELIEDYKPYRLEDFIKPRFVPVSDIHMYIIEKNWIRSHDPAPPDKPYPFLSNQTTTQEAQSFSEAPEQAKRRNIKPRDPNAKPTPGKKGGRPRKSAQKESDEDFQPDIE